MEDDRATHEIVMTKKLASVAKTEAIKIYSLGMEVSTHKQHHGSKVTVSAMLCCIVIQAHLWLGRSENNAMLAG